MHVGSESKFAFDLVLALHFTPPPTSPTHLPSYSATMDGLNLKQTRSLISRQYERARQQALAAGNVALDERLHDDLRTLRAELKLEAEVRRDEMESALEAKKQANPIWAASRDAKIQRKLRANESYEATGVANDAQTAMQEHTEPHTSDMVEKLHVEANMTAETRGIAIQPAPKAPIVDDQINNPEPAEMRQARLRRDVLAEECATHRTLIGISMDAARKRAAQYLLEQVDSFHRMGLKLPGRDELDERGAAIQNLKAINAGPNTMFYVVDTVGDTRLSQEYGVRHQ